MRKVVAEKELRFTFRPQPSYGFFWVEFEGDFDMQRLGLAYGEFISHPDYYPGIDELLDFSNTTLRHTSAEDARQIRRYVVEKPESLSDRCVWVVNTQLEYGLGRMITGLLGKDVHIDRQICFSIADALEWLRPGQAEQLQTTYDNGTPEKLI